MKRDAVSNEPVFRRFIPIGTAAEMDRLQSLAEEKSLSREDLALILRTIKLNHGGADELTTIKNELQNIRITLDFIRAEISTMDVDVIMDQFANDFSHHLESSVRGTP